MAIDRNEPPSGERPAYQAMAEHHPAARAARQETAPVQVAQATVTSDDIVKALTPNSAPRPSAAIPSEEAAARARAMSDDELRRKDPSAPGTTLQDIQELARRQAQKRQSQPTPR